MSAVQTITVMFCFVILPAIKCCYCAAECYVSVIWFSADLLTGKKTEC